jgi:hypothetical protein
MRDMRQGICAICNHPEVISAPAIEYSGDGTAVRLAVTHTPDDLDDYIPPSTRDADRPLGALRMYVCRSCGYVQWFANKPGKVPIDDAFGTTLLTPKGN